MKWKLLFTCTLLIFAFILFASSSPENHQQRGLHYIRAGLYNQAQQEFQRILSANPDDIESYYQLGKAYQLGNMLDRAINIYHQVLQRETAKNLHGLIYLSLTEIYVKQGDFKSAETSVQQAIRLNPQMAQTHYQLGNVYVHRNRLDLAKIKFSESIKLDPDFAEAYQWLGRIALMQNQLEKSIGYYKKAITLKPDDASSYYNLAKIHRLKGDSSRVTEYLEKFKKIKSYQDEVYRYKKSVDENPADLLIRMDLAGIHLNNDNINEALNVYRSIILLDPTMASAYDKLGKAYMVQGSFQEAINAFEKVVKLDQNAVEPYLRLAWIYSNQRMFDLAESHLQIATKKSPNLTLPYHGLAEIYVQQGKWEKAIETISVGQISGAVGTYQHIDPEIEILVCERLGIAAETISNQVIQRDRHTDYLLNLALIGATIEKISIEIRHLQRTEVLEVEEYFQKGQKGSSAMPHKRNPIVTERMSGFARLLRSNAIAALENVALWHERDISHSSVERIILPDSTTLMDYMLNKMIFLMKNLYVYPDNMMKNINLTNGLIFSQEILLALVKSGMVREDAYKLVQKNAMQVWKEKKSFKRLLKEDKKIMNFLSEEKIDKLFDLDKILININKIYQRVGLVK